MSIQISMVSPHQLETNSIKPHNSIQQQNNALSTALSHHDLSALCWSAESKSASLTQLVYPNKTTSSLLDCFRPRKTSIIIESILSRRIVDCRCRTQTRTLSAASKASPLFLSSLGGRTTTCVLLLATICGQPGQKVRHFA